MLKSNITISGSYCFEGVEGSVNYLKRVTRSCQALCSKGASPPIMLPLTELCSGLEGSDLHLSSLRETNTERLKLSGGYPSSEP